MKINNKVLSVPPYISTSWNYVEGLYMKGATLVITLSGGESVNIPGLKPEIIGNVFAAHGEFLEQEAIPQPIRRSISPSLNEIPFGLMSMGQPFPIMPTQDGAFQLGISSMDGFGTAMHHNPAQADAPDLPAEVLEKIGAIVKIVASDDVIGSSSAVPNCNCPYCQITRVIMSNQSDNDGDFHSDKSELVEIQEAPVEPWHVQQSGENQFLVVNRLDLTEHKVFLGHPIGCTCGKEGCEHILAVLKS